MPETFSWNPIRPAIVRRNGASPRVALRARNFGDMLAVPLVERLLALRGLAARSDDPRRLLTVGSVLHFAHGPTVVWGSGVNPKIALYRYRRAELDVRAVRGPITAEFLRSRGVTVPAVHGDPALLVGRLFPDLLAAAAGPPRYPITYVPNLNERRRSDVHGLGSARYLDPRDDLDHVLRRISRSGFVLGSSLHAIIVAESLGVPARFVAPTVEHEAKYRDYLLGTGRPDVRLATSADEALALGGMRPPEADLDALMDVFPYDLWARPVVSEPSA